MTDLEKIDQRIERLEKEKQRLTESIKEKGEKIAKKLVKAVLQDSQYDYRRATSLRRSVEQERTFLILFNEELEALKQYKESIN
jgi:uncharacterized protein (UPF0335 family)